MNQELRMSDLAHSERPDWFIPVRRVSPTYWESDGFGPSFPLIQCVTSVNDVWKYDQ